MCEVKIAESGEFTEEATESEALGQLGQDEPASGMALEPLDGLCPIGQCGHWNTSSELKRSEARRRIEAPSALCRS